MTHTINGATGSAVASRRLSFRVASTPDEFEQIHRLNYDTFVEEIPQHTPNAERRLVDQFHPENTYLVALEGDELVGMMALRDRRPFSLDLKLGNIDHYLPATRGVFEVRLLSVVPRHRKGRVFPGLARMLHEQFGARGFELAVISGAVRQLPLYQHLGFIPFGPRVGTLEAPYQPMYVTRERFAAAVAPAAHRGRRRMGEVVRLTTGPVATRPEVLAALAEPPTSHRGEGFERQFESVRQDLRELVNAPHVQILVGTGTLANDVVAAQLSLLDGGGLILVNGEFGERLVDHACRFNLRHDAVRLNWGEVIDEPVVREALSRRPDCRWVWAVGCETSTGVVNDVGAMKNWCGRRGARLSLDAISLIGTVPVDLGGVYLATCASGKALGAVPGLALVFHQDSVAPCPARLPRYLDLGLYAASRGVPFTHSSNLVAALRVAARHCRRDPSFREVAERSAWLRPRLRALGFQSSRPTPTPPPR